MPYPVLPPSPPPIVDVLPAGESHSATSPHATAAAASAISPEVDSRSGDQEPPVSDDVGSSPNPSSPTATSAECVVNCNAPVNPEAVGSPPLELGGASSAALLGAPITIDRFSRPVPTGFSARDLQPSQPPLPTVLPRSTVTPESAFLPLPDLDTLGQKLNPFQAAQRPPRPSSGSPTRVAQTAAAEPLDSSESSPGYTGDSIRLDLPVSEPTEPNSSESVTPESPAVAPETVESPAIDEPLQPVPQPTGGQILNIPTTPRTREEETTESTPATPPTPGGTPPGSTPPIDLQQQGEVVEITADQQVVDERRQVFQADGDVVVRFRQAVLSANRVRVNGPNRVAVAEGNAVLTRGDQVLGGDRFEFNFGLNQGQIQGARGQLLIPATERDFNPDPFTPLNTGAQPQAVTTSVSSAQPLQVYGGAPGLSFGVGDLPSSQSNPGINRLRFEADQAVFDGADLVAENVRLTNDPFSPPELELRSSHVTYTRLTPFTSEIRARNPRLVFDQGFSLPLLVNRIVLDNRRRNSGLLNFGFDEEDRDGFYIERSFNLYTSPVVDFTVTPQILVQRAIEQGDFPQADQFGLVANLNFNFTPTTTAQAVANFSSLDFSDIGDHLRASFRAQQRVFNHTVAAEYSYRNRLFNGSLGFQTVQSSVGLVVSSPLYVLGNSQINLRYQGSLQYINAQTDQRDLLPLDRTNQPPGTPDNLLPLDPDRDLSCIDPDERDTTGNGCVSLTRYQAAATLSRMFYLWFGTALPPTPTEGMRYTPYPITPYVGIYLNAQGVFSGYSSGNSQSSLQGGITLLGQFGHFSRPFFDYTAFSIGYSNTLQDGESPFLFDRVADQQVLSASLTQQIYGPLRAGVQVYYNVETDDDIDTVYTLEYSRRTYSIIASYSTGREAGYLTFRLNDFNWTGDPGPFSGLGSNSVESGVIRGIN